MGGIFTWIITTKLKRVAPIRFFVVEICISVNLVDREVCTNDAYNSGETFI